jgi:type II secretory pathway predicted ATPase ExeA
VSVPNKKLLALFGIKWNPFSPDIPTEGLAAIKALGHFAWRVENLAREGGFAHVMGPAGSGKSACLRQVAERLSNLRELRVAELERPQAGIADFYRELGNLFEVELTPHNRWAGAKVLREKWKAHLASVLYRPVLLVDEAQEMLTPVLKELRLLSSTHFDSHLLLTVVLAGDGRLAERFRSDDDLLPLASRVRARLALGAMPPEELADVLRQTLSNAGNAKLMTPELVMTLSEHAGGNLRAMMLMADELLEVGAEREVKQLDEKLYLEVFAVPPPTEQVKEKRERGGRRR